MLVRLPVLHAATSTLLPCTAGFDTSAAALAFTVYHIARTPRVERGVLAEIDAFGRAATPTYDDLDQVRFSHNHPH
jgi:cytochrome P450